MGHTMLKMVQKGELGRVWLEDIQERQRESRGWKGVKAGRGGVAVLERGR